MMPTPPLRSRRGFTLVEVLAAVAVLAILMLALTRMFMQGADISKRGTNMLLRNSNISTAMEILLQDAEGMIVNERVACYVEADASDASGFGFDDVWFISTAGDQDDDFPYEYVHFFVQEKTVTNSLGNAYKRFDLVKDRMLFAVGDNIERPDRFYALDPGDTQWWKNAKNFPRTSWDSQVLAENVVRFDIYCTGWAGDEWMGGHSGIHEFDSTLGPKGNASLRGIPPAAFDFYVQVTSHEAALEGGMALMPGTSAEVQRKGRELMIKESAAVFGRAVPVVGAAQFNRVTRYGTKNTIYYEN